MSDHCFAPSALVRFLAAALLAWPAVALAQDLQLALPQPPAQTINYRVNSAAQRLEMIVNTSRILTLDANVPRVFVNNPEMVRATPLSPNQIQISALRPGVTQVNMWDEAQRVFTVDVIVRPDSRELEDLLKTEFPDAALKLRPLSQSVVISGNVPTPEMVSRIVTVARDYYPNVINNMYVGGVQQVQLNVKVMEVSRSRLRALGIDWAAVGDDFFFVSTPSRIGIAGSLQGGVSAATGDTFRFGILGDDTAFFGFLEALRQKNLAKLLSEPTLVTVSGRPATVNVGGEFPIIVPQSLGTVSIEYRQFGTRVDFVPIVLGNGRIRLEVRPQVTERDDANGVNGVPALTTRYVDTAVEMQAGQTLALAGLLQHRVESENRGIPVLADLPWVGAGFRRVEERVNEVELLFMVRPEFAEALEACEVPQCGPGQFTTTPTGTEFFGRGYTEVPKCCDDGSCGPGAGAASMDGYEMVSPNASAPVETLPVPSQPVAPGGPNLGYNRSTPNNVVPVSAKIPEPGFIGPVGYDVLKK
jgi:pilus assembly protein CpaC